MTLTPEQKIEVYEVLKDFTLMTYAEAGIDIPAHFDPLEESVRVAVALREQGMRVRFKLVNGKELR